MYEAMCRTETRTIIALHGVATSNKKKINRSADYIKIRAFKVDDLTLM